MIPLIKVTKFLNKYKHEYKWKGLIRYLCLVIKPSKYSLKLRGIKINYLDSEILKKKYGGVSIEKFKIKTQKKIDKNNKVIWTSWLQGEDKAPQIVKTCIASMRRIYPDFNLIVVTEDNMKEYADFPDFILIKLKAGIIDRSHFSDLLRLELLEKHGGVWLDATVFCTNRKLLNDIYDSSLNLFVLKNCMRNNDSIVLSSWLIYAQSSNSIISLTKEMLYEYWKKNNYKCNYFLMHLMFSISTEILSNEWKEVPTYSNLVSHLMQEELFAKYDERRFNILSEASDFHKLSYKFDSEYFNKTNTIYKHILDM